MSNTNAHLGPSGKLGIKVIRANPSRLERAVQALARLARRIWA